MILVLEIATQKNKSHRKVVGCLMKMEEIQADLLPVTLPAMANLVPKV
jgi:hypothetical protein